MVFLMGWFDWLKPRSTNVDAQPDVIWVSNDAKLVGIRQDIEKASSRELPPAAIIVVAHFQKCREWLDGLGNRASTFVPMRLCLAKDLAAETRSSITPAEGQGIDIIVAERHPHAKYDEELLATAEALPFP